MGVIDPSDPEQALLWPKAIVEAELDRRLRMLDTARGRINASNWEDGTSRFLRAVFDGRALAEEFDAMGYRMRSWDSEPTEGQLTFIHQLRIELDVAREAAGARPIWSQRHGSVPETLNTADTMQRFATLVGRLSETHGLWAEAFGTDCPDRHGDPTEPADQQLADRLGRTVDGLTDWPVRPGSAALWSRDDFFDLVEVLHDLASWPATWSSHNFGGCIGHPGDFSTPFGRAMYRHEVNRLFSRSELDVRVADVGEDQGRIVLDDGAALAGALDDAVTESPTGYESDVAHAVALFRSRTRDVASMRSAVVALAGVVEAHRALLQRELLSKDEGALFDIANNFDLRHRKADQKTDYDPDFLEWLFHWYLATVALIGKLNARVARPVDAPGEEPF